MKYLSNALVALSLFAASSAVHAQVSLFGTTFDGPPSSTTYPYNDPTVYGGTGFPDLNAQGGWTATPTYADTTFDTSGTNIVGQVYSGAGSATASHGLNSPAFGGGYAFNTDFTISDNGSPSGMGNASGPGNNYSFSLLGTASIPVVEVEFVQTGASGGVENAYAPELFINGTLQTAPSATAAQGPVVDQMFHLSITVSTTGTVTASLGTPQSTFSATDPLAIGEVTGFSVGENDVTGSATNDLINFDNISLTVPEPSTYAMMGLGLVGMLGLMKFRRPRA